MHLRDEDLELYVLGQLSPSQVSTIEAHLHGCESCGSKLSQTVKFVQELNGAQQQGPAAGERRRSVRVPSDDPARLQVFSPLSPARSDVRVLDVSTHGLKLHVPEYLQPGTVVQIRLANSVVLGEVRYCLPASVGFHVGVSLEDVFENPPKTSSS